MRILRLLCRSAIAAGVGAIVTGLQIAPASAQLFWDWGGGSMVGGSGREVVSFSPQYAKGQIIVSFGDRRLYYITQPGQALSYPRSEEHTSELQSLRHLVCRLLL